jgi:hypothetical protein
LQKLTNLINNYNEGIYDEKFETISS